MGNLFEKELGIPLPQCCNHGDCCKGASPSTPYHRLMQRAADGDEFARGFFSIMVPYRDHAEAEKVVPGVVARTLKASEKLPDFQGPEDIAFYRCRYQTADNRCGVWEDRPQFCRDYPDTPFVVMAPGCAFEPWAKACKEKYHAMKQEVAQLKALKDELARLKAVQSSQGTEPDDAGNAGSMANGPLDAVNDVLTTAQSLSNGTGYPPETSGLVASETQAARIDAVISGGNNMDNLSLVLSLTGLYVSSPLRSVYL